MIERLQIDGTARLRDTKVEAKINELVDAYNWLKDDYCERINELETPPEEKETPLVVEPFDKNNPDRKNIYTMKEWNEKCVAEAIAAYKKRLVEELAGHVHLGYLNATEKGYRYGIKAAITIVETE